MAKIKLLKIDELLDGTIRLQSQLRVGSDTADFIIKDGVLKNWSIGKGGFGFFECDIDYEIVENKKDMMRQQL